MAEFKINKDLFGRYAKIPTGFIKEPHVYKIVTAFSSNAYCDTPLCTCKTKKTLHENITDVLNVVHCGIDESEIIRVALHDCEILPADVAPVRNGNWNEQYCSLCGGSYMDYADADSNMAIGCPLPNYCPHCGARMDGDEG